MHSTIDRRFKRNRAAQRLEEAKAWIDFQEQELLERLTQNKQEQDYWEDLAATKIQAVARGFLARLLTIELILTRDAAITVQRRWRGIQGRKLATEERWKQLAVAPSLYTVKRMLYRSTEIKRVGNWVELWDPDTNAFWYYNKLEKNHSTWEPPECFKDNLTCIWNPWPYPYSSPYDKPCRRRFKNMAEYQAHRATGHMWVCLSCQHQNSGLNFPKCSLCGNKVNEGGEDLESIVKKLVVGELTKLRWAEKAEEKQRQASLNAKELPAVPSSEGNRSLPKLPPSQKDEQAVSFPEIKGQSGKKNLAKHVSFADSVMTDIMEFDLDGENQKKNNQKLNPGGQGMFSGVPFDDPQNMTLIDFAITTTEEINGVEGYSSISGPSDPFSNMLDGEPTLKICENFMSGYCTLLSCPRAHPGLRDTAQHFSSGHLRRRAHTVVKLCKEYIENNGKCPRALHCTYYHPYIRPSTEEIIRKLYPPNSGKKIKIFSNGAKLDGETINDVFQGYGVFTWPDGSTYMGNWKDNLRHGYGVYRTVDGKEFLGTYVNGVRHGPGALFHPNGETYYGDFENGKLTGVGRLESANNDVYEGQFFNGIMEGVGVFKKGNGDKYMGHIKRNKAEGYGVLVYACGIKYKGDFKEDFRHGRGMCAYPDGAKYAGRWEKNYHSGYGIFISSEKEKYVGHWKNSMKDGYGRYYFKNGDIYDGDFVENKACGQGLYFYRNEGNYYVGRWENDKKNGFGTYIFKNTSRYQGQWKDNAVHGKGKFWYANGNSYFGDFTMNRKNGKGVYTWDNGNVYKGDFVFDRIEGQGDMTYKVGGHRYVGDWKNNKKHGTGIFYYSDGNIYEGEFKEEEIEGKGKLRIHPGTIIEETYEGDWQKGVKHGYGIYRYRELDGKIYEGYWENGLRHGKGVMKFKDGSYYKGDFVMEQWHGRGVFVWADGSQYDGDWVENERHGEGTFLSTDGSIYQGKFSHNMKHGTGVITYLNGNSYEGIWNHDDIVGKGTFILQPGQDEKEMIHLSVFGY